MISKYITLFILLLGFSLSYCQDGKENFTDLEKFIPEIILDIRYFSSDNFTGTRVDGYLQPKAYLTKEAAQSLKKVQKELNSKGMGLKVFDSYRPQKAVNNFIRWAKVPEDTVTKSKYYPEVDKKDVFDLGYVASRSGHTRGSTLDLTIIDLKTKKDLDMGSSWDYFGEISGHGTDKINSVQEMNRKLLKSIMEKHGFKSYSKEWWHYTLRNEPFPDTYFDFNVE